MYQTISKSCNILIKKTTNSTHLFYFFFKFVLYPKKYYICKTIGADSMKA